MSSHVVPEYGVEGANGGRESAMYCGEPTVVPPRLPVFVFFALSITRQGRKSGKVKATSPIGCTNGIVQYIRGCVNGEFRLRRVEGFNFIYYTLILAYFTRSGIIFEYEYEYFTVVTAT